MPCPSGRRRPKRSSARSTALTEEGNAIIDEHGEEPDDEDRADRLYEIQERVAELSEGEESWPDAAKAEAGAVIGIGHNGELDIRRGLIRPEDRAAAKKPRRPSPERREGRERDRSLGGAGRAVDGAPDGGVAGAAGRQSESGAGRRRACAGAAIASTRRSPIRACGSAASQTCLPGSAEGIEDGAARKQFAASTKAATKGMPKQPEKLWAWLIEQDQKALLAILAVCAAHDRRCRRETRGTAERAADFGPCGAARAGAQARHGRILAADRRGVFRECAEKR